MATLSLPADALIDLQLHTTLSDGRWEPAALLAHLAANHFALAAITDHDRPDVAPHLQALAAQHNFPLLAAVEMTTAWNGGVVDVLCFGGDLAAQPLAALAADVARRQAANTTTVFERLVAAGQLPPAADLAAVLRLPSAQQPHGLVGLVQAQGCERRAAEDAVFGSGCGFATSPIAAVVEAAHACGALAIIAHPGREDGFVCFDAQLLDALRAEVAIDGIEAYYPAHSPERTALFVAYAQEHGLLISAGSDSHSPESPPIPYPAHRCAALLARLGITLAEPAP